MFVWFELFKKRCGNSLSGVLVWLRKTDYVKYQVKMSNAIRNFHFCLADIFSWRYCQLFYIFFLLPVIFGNILCKICAHVRITKFAFNCKLTILAKNCFPTLSDTCWSFLVFLLQVTTGYYRLLQSMIHEQSILL